MMRHVKAAWNRWRKVSDVLCSKRVSAKMKGKVWKTKMKAAMLLVWRLVLRKIQETELEVAELKMLMFSLSGMRMDKMKKINCPC